MNHALKGISILVVEDDTDTRELLRILLQGEDGVVRATASVQEALAAYDQSRPDVIVADIGMPEYNGYTLIGRVRARDREQHKMTPAIALTAYTTPTDRDTILSAGFQMHMPKPFEPDKLISAIGDLAKKYRESNGG
ncbi:MAG TPA: response regulator [Terriglobia bacterium]|jgi:CheY-like chemotaxis protein|nr:response regulator [Terriglobia bacterium]